MIPLILFFIGMAICYVGLLMLYFYDQTIMWITYGGINLLGVVCSGYSREWREIITISLGLLFITLMWSIHFFM